MTELRGNEGQPQLNNRQNLVGMLAVQCRMLRDAECKSCDRLMAMMLDGDAETLAREAAANRGSWVERF
jgi:hypothetical protein